MEARQTLAWRMASSLEVGGVAEETEHFGDKEGVLGL